ncbi:hypothetical protein Tco_0815459 [Tanacetum coccineum]
MTTPITTSTTDSQMHNNIMAAGSRDHPPMLAPGRYDQWKSPIPTTDDSPAVPERTAIETLLNMSSENKEHYQSEKEAIHLLLIGIGDEIYSTVDACKTAHDMWIAIDDFNRVNLLTFKMSALICFGSLADSLLMMESQWNPYYQAPKSHKSYASPSKQSSSTRSNATTKLKGKEIAKPITPSSESASEEDNDPEQAQRDKEMQKNLALIAKKPKTVKDYMYHKEKMLMCKQAEKGVPLQAEQAD